MFKPAPPLDVQITALYQEIFGRKPNARQLAEWLRDISEKKITLENLREILLASRVEADQIEKIDEAAAIDDTVAASSSWSALASAVPVTGIGASSGGSSMLGIIAGGAAMAAAAGGGGGGGSSTPTSTLPTKTFSVGTAPLLVQPYWWLGDAIFVDLNRDGIDEVILLGAKSWPSTIENWSDSLIQILGFNTGRLAIETSRWLPGQTNRVLAASGGQITGDFNGDGWTDIWVAPTTDMRHYGPGVVLLNQNGQSLRRVEIDIGDIWIHDSAVGDFNADGFDDILPIGWGPDYRLLLGRSDGNFDVLTNNGPAPFGAGIAVADFLGNGTLTFVITDTERIGNSDTGLYTLDITNGGFRLDRIATLPADRFYLSKWQGADFDWDWDLPHSIRALPHDFNSDGRTDVIVFTVNYDNNIDGHTWSEVQFLRNNGNASFTDVTDSVLVNFNHRSNLGISPRLVDINDDGRLDLWITSGDGDGIENSSRVLLATPDGRFVETMTPALTQFRQDVGGETSFVHYLEDSNGRDYLLGIEKYSYTGNNQVEIVAASLSNYYSAGWIA